MTPQQRREQHDRDLAWLLSTEQGRRMAWSLLKDRTGSMGSTYAGELTHEAAYLEGKRAVGLQLTLDLQRVAAPEYLHMLTEAFSNSAEDQLDEERDRAEEKADGDGG